MKGFRRNNRGLSLVELIVSVAILAIIVLPLLSSFVTATRTNVKARNKFRATNVADNIMEGFETASVSEMAYQFNYPAEGFDLFSLSSDSTVMQVIPAGTSYSEVTKREDVPAEISNPEDMITSAILKDLSGKGYTFLPNEDTYKYYFFASNIQSDNKKYNAFITLDAKTKDMTSINSKYNNMELAEITAIDSNYDAMNNNTDTASQVLVDIGKNNLNQSDVERTITVDIDGNAAGATKVRVTYSYEYTYEGVRHKFPEDGASNAAEYTSLIYDNSDNTDCYLRNIYLFYQPWETSPNSLGYIECDDHIIINNNKNISCGVSIIKQIDSIPSDRIDEFEQKYGVLVEVVEPSNSSGDPLIRNNSNLKTASPERNTPQVYYMYNNNVNQNQVIAKLKSTGIESAEKEDRLYDVKVEIYDKSVGLSDISGKDPIVTFTGSMVE